MPQRRRNLPVVVVLVIGLGLALAPAIFSMFSRAPAGGAMIDDFRPYMTHEEIDQFRGYLVEIDDADRASTDVLRPMLEDSGALDGADFDTRLNGVVALNETWPEIEADMTDLLDRMEANLGNYAAVDALPPFSLFPWFFVVPGLLIAGVAGSVLWSRHRGHPATARVWVLMVLGAAVALAPVAFQMFGRAPQGGSMIDSFRPMMTRDRVQDVQGYFITMGMAEGQLRTVAVPLADGTGLDASELAAIEQFSEDWPGIVADFNPMVATMSDNVDNFEGIDALPPFGLFPWFFLVPGLLVLGCGVLTLRAGPRQLTEPRSSSRGAGPETTTGTEPGSATTPPEEIHA